MASPDALKTLIEALEEEQERRRKALYGGHDDPRQWLLEELQQIAGRFAATGGPPKNDSSPMERLAALLYLPMDEAEREAETKDLNDIFRECGIDDLIVTVIPS
jgi:hypothetical protein